MAGVYGEINNRADFQTVLDKAITDGKALHTTRPGDETIEAIVRQLEAVKAWSANGQIPTEDDRESIDIGVRASREFEGTTKPTLGRALCTPSTRTSRTGPATRKPPAQPTTTSSTTTETTKTTKTTKTTSEGPRAWGSCAPIASPAEQQCPARVQHADSGGGTRHAAYKDGIRRTA